LTFYPWALIGRVGSATIDIPLQSTLRRSGLCYIQYYGSIKEVLAAGNTYPFSNQNLIHLSVNDRVSHIFQAIGGSLAINPDTLRRAYQHTKLRCHHAFLACENQMYGSRFEFRITLRLFRGVHAQMLLQPPIPSPEPVGPTVTWVVHPTSLLLDWNRWNINKYCFMFESILSMNKDKAYIPWESTRAMILFLQCIACFIGTQRPSAFPQLWRSQYHSQRPGRPSRVPTIVIANRPVRHGLGIGPSLQECGYGWIMDRFDWTLMVIRPEFSQSLGAHQLPFMQIYRTRYRQLRHASDSYVSVQITANWLRQWRQSGVHLELIGRYLHQLCIRSFQRDILNLILPFVKARYRPYISKEKVGLSYDWLDRIIDPEKARFRIMHGNRIRVSHFLTMCQWLWEDTGHQHRGPWAKSSYRLLYSVANALITEIVGEQYAKHWRFSLWMTLERTCWMIPYPSATSLIGSTVRRGKRVFQWWSNHNGPLLEYLEQHINLQPGHIVTLDESSLWPMGSWERVATESKNTSTTTTTNEWWPD
jgi:hypothetical protein